jgi:hypothetical protein
MRTTLRHLTTELDWRWLSGLLAAATLASFILAAAQAPTPIVALVFGSLAAMVFPAVRSLVGSAPRSPSSGASARSRLGPSVLHDRETHRDGPAADDDLRTNAAAAVPESEVDRMQLELNERLQQAEMLLRDRTADRNVEFHQDIRQLQEEIVGLRRDFDQHLQQQAEALLGPVQGEISALSRQILERLQHQADTLSITLQEDLSRISLPRPTPPEQGPHLAPLDPRRHDFASDLAAYRRIGRPARPRG